MERNELIKIILAQLMESISSVLNGVISWDIFASDLRVIANHVEHYRERLDV